MNKKKTVQELINESPLLKRRIAEHIKMKKSFFSWHMNPEKKSVNFTHYEEEVIRNILKAVDKAFADNPYDLKKRHGGN